MSRRASKKEEGSGAPPLEAGEPHAKTQRAECVQNRFSDSAKIVPKEGERKGRTKRENGRSSRRGRTRCLRSCGVVAGLRHAVVADDGLLDAIDTLLERLLLGSSGGEVSHLMNGSRASLRTHYTLSHRDRVPTDGVGPVEAVKHLLELALPPAEAVPLAGLPLSLLPQRLNRLQHAARLLELAVPHERRRDVPHAVPQRARVVVRQRLAQHLAQRADDLPVLPRCAGRRDGRAAELRASLGVDPGDALLGVGAAGQDDVGVLRADVAVVALVDDERVARDRRGGEVVGVEEVDELGRRLVRRCGRDEADVVRSCPRGGLCAGRLVSTRSSGELEAQATLTRWRTL